MPDFDLPSTGLFHIINEEYRVTTVTEYIGNHKGCTAQEIVDGQKVNGREKVFKILGELKKVGMISEEKDERDRRKKKLFLTNDHPLVSIPSELNNFETNFMQLVQKSIYEFKLRYAKVINRYPKLTQRISELSDIYQLVRLPLHIFHDISNLFNISSIYCWSQIRDDNTLNALHIITYRKLLNIQMNLFRVLTQLEKTTQDSAKTILKSVFIDRLLDTDRVSSYKDKIELYFSTFARFGLGKYIKPILDLLWKLTYDHRDLLYMGTEQLDIKYEDGWKGLITSKD
jgi:hypothetical protein